MHQTILCLLLALCFSALSAQPQQTLTEIPAELSLNAKAYSFSDENGLTLVFQEAEQIRVFLLSPQMHLQHSFSVPLPQERDAEILGFTNQAQALYLYYRLANETDYLVKTISKQDGSTQNGRVNLRERKAHLHAGAFTYRGTLHILRMPRNSQQIRLCKFEEGGSFSAEVIELDRADFGEKVNYELKSILPDSSLELQDTYFAGKMYQDGPYLYLTLDEPGATYLVSINLPTHRQQERSLPAPAFREGAFKSNSLIWQDLILQLAASADSLKLHIRDLRSGALMAAYTYGKDDPLDLVNGRLLQQRAKNSPRIVGSTADFLAQCAEAPHLAIAARNLPDSLLVFVAGAITPIQQRGVSGIVLSEAYERTWFESQFDLLSLSPALPMASSPRWPRRPKPAPLRMSIEWQGQTLAGYYDVRSGRYVIRN